MSIPFENTNIGTDAVRGKNMSRVSPLTMADKVKSKRAKPATTPTPSSRPSFVSSVSSEMGSSDASVEVTKIFKDIKFAKVEDKFTVVIEYDSIQQVLRIQLTNQMTKNAFVQEFNRKNIHKITDHCKLQPDVVVKMLIDTLDSRKLTASKMRMFVFDDQETASSKYKEFRSLKRVPAAKHIPTGFSRKSPTHSPIQSTVSQQALHHNMNSYNQSMILNPQSEDGQERCLLLVLHFSAPPYIYHNYGFIIPGVYVSEFERLAMKMDDLQREIRSLQNTVYSHSKKFGDVFDRMANLNEINGVLTQRFLLHQIDEKVQYEPKAKKGGSKSSHHRSSHHKSSTRGSTSNAVTPRLSQTKPTLLDVKSCPAPSPSPSPSTQIPAAPAPSTAGSSSASSVISTQNGDDEREQSRLPHQRAATAHSRHRHHHRVGLSMSRLSDTPLPTELSMEPFTSYTRYHSEDSKEPEGVSDVEEIELNLKNGWMRYNEQWSPPKAIRIGRLVYLSGLIKSGMNGHISTLPNGWRPSKQKMYCQATNGDQTRVDILADGRIYQQTQFWSFLSLEGMSFVIGCD